MKKFLAVLITGVLIFSISSELINAQEISVTPKKNKAFFGIDVSGSFDLPLMDLSGSDIGGFWTFSNYGVSTGFGTSVNVKMSVFNTKMTQLRTYLTLGYTQFTNSDNLAYTVGVAQYGWPNINNKPFYPIPTKGESSIRINMPNIAVGMEYAVYLDRGNRSAFNFSGDFTVHDITGRIYETVGTSGETFNTISPSLRFGFGASVVYSYRFEDAVGFHVGTRFVLPNFLGKTSEVTNEPGYVSLMDKGNAVINPMLISGRTMAYLNFFTGMSFYIGKK